MPDYVLPFGFIVLRAGGALLLFLLVHTLFFKEKVALKDYPRLALCGLFGVAINQLLFFKGLSITTPINASIIMTSNPILVLIAASVMLRERITWIKIIGIVLGLSGAISLIFFKNGINNISFGSDSLLGDALIFINAASYGVYLVIVKPLMQRYKPITVIKWVFLFGFLFVLPVGFEEFTQIQWKELPVFIWLEILFVVVFTTFFAYLLNVNALKKVSPSVVSIYIYLQPLLATAFAISLGKDSLDVLKVVAASLIFAGVFLVSKNWKRSPANE